MQLLPPVMTCSVGTHQPPCVSETSRQSFAVQVRNLRTLPVKMTSHHALNVLMPAKMHTPGQKLCKTDLHTRLANNHRSSAGKGTANLAQAGTDYIDT